MTRPLSALDVEFNNLKKVLVKQFNIDDEARGSVIVRTIAKIKKMKRTELIKMKKSSVKNYDAFLTPEERKEAVKFVAGLTQDVIAGKFKNFSQIVKILDDVKFAATPDEKAMQEMEVVENKETEIVLPDEPVVPQVAVITNTTSTTGTKTTTLGVTFPEQKKIDLENTADMVLKLRTKYPLKSIQEIISIIKALQS